MPFFNITAEHAASAAGSEAASLTAEEAAASEEAAELAGVPDAPQPVSAPTSIAPASRRANLLFSFMMIYLDVSILQKRIIHAMA